MIGLSIYCARLPPKQLCYDTQLSLEFFPSIIGGDRCIISSHREEETKPPSKPGPRLRHQHSSNNLRVAWQERDGHQRTRLAKTQRERSPNMHTVDGIRRRDDFTSNLTYIPCIHTTREMVSVERTISQYIRLPLRFHPPNPDSELRPQSLLFSFLFYL